MDPEVDNYAAGMTLQDMLNILRRRRVTIIQTFLVIASCGTVLTLLTKPVYEASARLLVDAPSTTVNTADLNNPLTGILQSAQPPSMSTHVELLQSKTLMDKIRNLVPENAVSVTQVKDTNIIEVSAESNDPRAAASAPNTLLSAYLDQDRHNSLDEIKKAEEFARTQGLNAHMQLITIEQQLRAFKQTHHVTDLTKDRDATAERTSTLMAQVSKSQADLKSLESQIEVTRQLLANEPSVISYSLPTSNMARTAQQAELDKLKVERVARMGPGGFTAKSKPIIALDERIAAMQAQINAQPSVTNQKSSLPNQTRELLRQKLADLESQKASAEAQVKAANAALGSVNNQVGHFADWELALANLTREHDAAEATDKMFSEKLADLALRERAQHAAARIIQTALVPSVPVRPKRVQSIIFACLIGLFMGLCLALLQEFLDDRLNTAEEAGRLLELPSLGHVPALSASDARLLPLMEGHSPASESYRVLRTNIHFASIDAPARTLLVTSSNPGEGKSTTAANLAFAMAFDGKRVILVDTDLRRPSLHKLLGETAIPGLTDVLLGHASIDEVLRQNADLPSLSVLTSGSTPPNPSELLNSRTFRTLVDDLSDRADIVIFDSPPSLVTADAAILASQLDGTVFVVEPGQTKKAAARRAVQMLRQARANILGVAYNKMRAKDSGDYYYYQYQYSTPAIQNGNGAKPKLVSKSSNATGLVSASKEDQE